MTDVDPRTRPASLWRDDVGDIQRARIVSAMVEVASERGYGGAAVAPVVARAGVSRRTFYEMFDGREECFLAAFEWGVGQARQVVVEASASQQTWRERVRHGLAALLALLDAEPELARVCVVEALAAGKLVLARRVEVVDELASALDAEARRAGSAPVLAAEGVVGGAFSVIHARLLASTAIAGAGVAERDRTPGVTLDGGAPPLIAMHGQLMALIALPYLGPRLAGEEITRPAPELPPRELAAAGEDGGGGRLLEKLEMRLTYRTVRCLMFIAEHPGSSNREVVRGAEVPDEGQTSKLLARLDRLELIANSQAHGPGHPNRWTLTPHGRQVLSTVQGR